VEVTAPTVLSTAASSATEKDAGSTSGGSLTGSTVIEIVALSAPPLPSST
jgi:hypothetical protein